MSSGATVSLEVRGGVVYATVPKKFEGPLSSLVGLLRSRLSGVWIDWVAVREAYVHGRARPFPVAHQRPEAAQDEKAKIRFSSDGLCAYLLLYPSKPRGQRLTEGELLELVEAYGIPGQLMDYGALRAAHLRRFYHEPELIARGVPALDGVPARVRWRRGLPSDPEGFLQALAREDYPGEILAAVEAGEVVGDRRPAAPGTPGLSVRGEPIAPRAGEDPVRLGRGLGYSAGGQTVTATLGGHLQLTGADANHARIVPLFQVDDPQQLWAFGDGFVPGSLVVEGDLEAVGPIRVLGDLEVRGGVVRSAIDVLGSLFVRDGIIQHRGSPIRAGGIVSASFYERAWVLAHTVHVRRNSMKSRLLARDAVLSSPSASVYGGQIAACRRLAVAVLGSPNAIPTEAALAVPSFLAVFREVYTSWIAAAGQEGSSDPAVGELLAEAVDRWSAERDREPGFDLSAARAEASRVYSGVTVRIGSAWRQIDNALEACEFSYEQVGSRGRVSLTRRSR